HLIVEFVLCPGVRSGKELVEHVHCLIDGVAVALPEETDERRKVAGPGDLAEAVRRAFADIVEQGALVIGVQPGQVDGQDASGLNGSPLVGEALQGSRRGLGRVSLDRLKAGNRLSLLHLQQAVEGLRHFERKAPRQLGDNVLARANLFCSPTSRSRADSAGYRMRRSLRKSRARASSGAICSRRHDSSKRKRSKAWTSSGPKTLSLRYSRMRAW